MPVWRSDFRGSSGKGPTGAWGRRFAVGSLGLALLALILNLIPATTSGNLEMIALALPVHLSLCCIVLGIHRMEHALVYSDSVSGGGRRR